MPLFRFHLLARRFTLCLVSSALPLLACSSYAQDGALSQLYAARPPAGAAFVRVVNPFSTALQVRVGQGPVQNLDARTPATSYAIVLGGQRATVDVGGKQVGKLETRSDSFMTIVLKREGAGYAFATIDDTTETEDGLKAQLKFYNLATGCDFAQLQISSSGASVFKDVAFGMSAARSVNPVRAALVGRCGGVATVPQPLPAMQPGDHLSIFLTGVAGKPVLTMQPASTDAFKR